MKGFFVKFWGTRGSIPTPGYRTQKYGGNTSCVEMRVDGTLFICDGGSGLRELGLDLLNRRQHPIVAHMFFSHAHWDHIQGFPFFVPAYLPENTFFVYGTSAGDTRLFRLLSGQMRSDYFPINFSDLRAHIVPRDLVDGTSEIEGVTVSCIELHHPGQSFAYSFESQGRKVVYATDNEIDLVLGNPEEADSDPSALRLVPPQLVQFARGADLLIADGQYADEEYPSKVNWGHARATSAVDLAVQAQVKQLAIFHHDPLQSDDDVTRKVDVCCERAHRFAPDLSIFAAREGVELRIE